MTDPHKPVGRGTRPALPIARRKGRLLFGGRLLITTVEQPRTAPRIDTGHARCKDGRRFHVFVFGTGPHALVIGRPGVGPEPILHTWPHRAPRPLRPLATWLFTTRGPR